MLGPSRASLHDAGALLHSRGQSIKHLLIMMARDPSRGGLGALRLQCATRAAHSDIVAGLLLVRCAVELQDRARRAAILVQLPLVEEPRFREEVALGVGRA